MKPAQKVNVAALGVEVIQPSAPAAANDWWDPNAAGLCIVAAYRAINTPGNPWPNDAPPNYAATLINNANPGVFNLVEVNGAVPWVVNIGWQFAAAAVQAFDTTIFNAGGVAYSSLCQYAAVANTGTLYGVTQAGGTKDYRIQPNVAAVVRYFNGTFSGVAPIHLAGNVGMSGLQGYRDGALDGAPTVNGVPCNAWSAFIGARNFFGGVGLAITADIRAVAFYNCALTGPQMLAVATAMSQL